MYPLAFMRILAPVVLVLSTSSAGFATALESFTSSGCTESGFSVPPPPNKEVLSPTSIRVTAKVNRNCARGIGDGSIAITPEGKLELRARVLGQETARCMCRSSLEYVVSAVTADIEIVPHVKLSE